LPVTFLMAISAFHCAISGPFELTAPRPISTFLNGGCSTSRPSNGGFFQSAGSLIGIVSYIQYSTTVFGAPSSQRA
jgi:hypothetical protein